MYNLHTLCKSAHVNGAYFIIVFAVRYSLTCILCRYIQDCHVQKVTVHVHAGVLLSDATVLSSPRSPDVVLGERVLRMLISCPERH